MDPASPANLPANIYPSLTA